MNKQETVQTISVSNSAVDSRLLAAFLQDFFQINGIDENLYGDIRLAMEETFINIVNHAHEEQDKHPVSIELKHAEDCLTVRFIDSGIAFNPLQDCTNCIENNQHEDGGMGIHLIRSLTDSQEYQRIDGRNIFTLIKYYTKEKP